MSIPAVRDNILETIKKREKKWILISLLVYATCVTTYVVWNNAHARQEIFRQIDERLTLGATALKFLLAPDFHDRAIGPESISLDEELKNRQTVTTYGLDSGFKWIYTLVEKDGKFFFSAPSVSEEEAKEQERWYYYPYDDLPQDFVRAFHENRTVFSTYTDQWGTFRSIAKPELSPEGRRYLACADYDISYVQALLRKNLYQSILTALAFFLFSLPFLLAFRHAYAAFNKKMGQINQELAAHKDNLEVLVTQRTAELQRAKENSEALVQDLAKALDEVKTLRGFLPICASCKKIRDDQGYWQDVEEYIEARSDAAFSHSICPDCVRKLYPEIADQVLKPKPPS